jgi:cytochrome d ubiquinol oxidase subunit II
MNLNILWFGLIGVLYIVYFVLEGFDMGAGILLPFVAKEDKQRRVVLNAIGPHWDGNEVWLLTAGGATFAAFPQWYATLFSGFYLPLFLILIALIFRGVAFEFRSRDDNKVWRATWDWAIFFGSVIPALLWGVAFANIVKGVPIDATMTYTGGFWNLLNPFALVAGLVSLIGFTLHGALFLSLKTTGDVEKNAKAWIKGLWVAALVVFAGLIAGGFTFAHLFSSITAPAVLVLLLAFVVLFVLGILALRGKTGIGFVLSTVVILLTTAAIFLQLFPNVMVSSTDPALNLTIYNASSSQYTLGVMAKVALFLVPVVLAYTAWSYWIFRRKVTTAAEDLKY